MAGLSGENTREERNSQQFSLTQKQINAVLDNPHHSSKEILSLFEQDFGKIFKKDAGVGEGYTIGEHTAWY